METAAIHSAKQVLLVVGLILGTGTLSGILSRTLRVPDVALFLLFGILLGPQAAGLIDVRVDSSFNQVILIFGSCYILFDGGAALRVNVLKRVWITVVAISTL